MIHAGKLIKKARMLRRLTQQQLADRLQYIKRGYIATYETTANLTTETIYIIAKELGYKLSLTPENPSDPVLVAEEEESE